MKIHQLYDNQSVLSSKATVDKIRGSGGPHSVNVTSQWLLILTPHHSSQYIIVLLLIHDLSLYDRALRAATKWQPVLKNTLYISAKILLIFTLQSQKKVHWMSRICLVYIGYWQHSPEIESSSKLECIYHEPLTTRCINCEISWNLICFQFSVLLAFIHNLFPYPCHFSHQQTWAKIAEKWVCLWGSLANPFTGRPCLLPQRECRSAGSYS